LVEASVQRINADDVRTELRENVTAERSGDERRTLYDSESYQ
jgi:hypothetical protein